jgi:hypothetical protein
LVFTNDQAEVQGENAPIPAIHLRKLKDFIRQQTKDHSLRGDVLLRVKTCLPQE